MVHDVMVVLVFLDFDIAAKPIYAMTIFHFCSKMQVQIKSIYRFRHLDFDTPYLI